MTKRKGYSYSNPNGMAVKPWGPYGVPSRLSLYYSPDEVEELLGKVKGRPKLARIIQAAITSRSKYGKPYEKKVLVPVDDVDFDYLKRRELLPKRIQTNPRKNTRARQRRVKVFGLPLIPLAIIGGLAWFLARRP